MIAISCHLFLAFFLFDRIFIKTGLKCESRLNNVGASTKCINESFSTVTLSSKNDAETRCVSRELFLTLN